MIADYETIEKPFGNKKGNPRYIYFVGKSNYIEKWLEKSKKVKENHNNLLSENDDDDLWHDDDDDDNDDDDDDYFISLRASEN